MFSVIEMDIRHLSIAALLTALFPFTSAAGDFKVAVGAFFSQADTSIGVTDPFTGQPYELDLESDLSLKERSTLPYLLIGYDFNDRHGVFLDWRSLHRDATNEFISKPFQIPGEDYLVQAGARIESTLNIDILRIGYTYKFYDGEDWDWKAQAGLHVMNFTVGIGGELGVRSEENGDIITPINKEEFTSLTAPLPNIGLVGEYWFNEDWQLLGHAQVFALTVDDISGMLLDLGLGFEYQFTQDLGLAATYSYYEINVDYGYEFADLDARFRFFGPKLMLSYAF